MTLPKNKRGFRKIIVDGQNFNWKLAGVIDIRPELQKENKLIIDFGWFDELLYLNDKENQPIDFEPRVITPAFVRQGILYALANGWDPKEKTGLTQVKYRNQSFEKNALQQ